MTRLPREGEYAHAAYIALATPKLAACAIGPAQRMAATPIAASIDIIGQLRPNTLTIEANFMEHSRQRLAISGRP